MDYYDPINKNKNRYLDLTGRTNIYYRFNNLDDWNLSSFVGQISLLESQFPNIQLAVKRSLPDVITGNKAWVGELINKYGMTGQDKPDKPEIPYRYEEIKDDTKQIIPAFYYKINSNKSKYHKCSGWDWRDYKNHLGFMPTGTQTIGELKKQAPEIIFFRRTSKPRFKCSKPYPYGY